MSPEERRNRKRMGKIRKDRCLALKAKDMEVVEAYVPKSIGRHLRKLTNALAICPTDKDLREELRWIYGACIIMRFGVDPEVERFIDFVSSFSLMAPIPKARPDPLMTMQIDCDRLTRELQHAARTTN